MSFSGIHGQLLEVTVVSCSKLKDTEWISRQDPYVCVEYGSSRFRTRTCTDGHKNPTFQEKYVFTLIEGLRELNAVVWNSNSMSSDDFIGNGKIQLQKVLSQGYDDCSWTLQSRTGRYAGEVRLILHYASANKPTAHYAPSAPQYMTPPPIYSAQPPVSSASYPSPFNTYSAPPSYPPSYPPSSAAYPPQPTGYPSAPYPPQPTAYPPAPYPPQATAYPPAPYPPQSVYPPASAPHYPPSPFHGFYPPPHY